MEPEIIHLDSASAAKVSGSALALFKRHCLESYANQEGSGELSRRVAMRMSDAARRMAKALCDDTHAKVLWCNTGTDALIAAVESFRQAKDGDIVISSAEHQALDSAVSRMAAKGTAVKRVGLLPDGSLDMAAFEAALDSKTALVAIHHVQAEIGAVQDLLSLRGAMDRKSPKALLLSDTTQSACKLGIPWNEARLDFATLSGQKLGCPGGAALIYRDTKTGALWKRLTELRRKEHLLGRCPAHMCLTLADMVESLCNTIEGRAKASEALRESFKTEISKATKGAVRFTIPDSISSPYILHLSTPYFQGAILARMLAGKGFSVASGSACQSETPDPSKTLLAIGYDREQAYCALRISLWESSLEPKVAADFASALAECLLGY